MPPHRWARGLRFNVWTCERCGARVIAPAAPRHRGVIAVPAGRRLAAAPASRRPRISRASRPPTVADAGTDGQGSPQRLDCTGTHGHTGTNVAAFVIVGMCFNEVHRPEAAAFRPLPPARSVLRTAALRSAAALTGHARNPRLGPAVGPRDRIGKSCLLPHLRPRGRAASNAVPPAASVASNSRARGPQRRRDPGRVSNLVPDALGSPDSAPARPPGERHAGSDVRAWFPSGAPSSA